MLARVPSTRAQEGMFARSVKASLVFREDSDATRHYPHLLRVFLRLDNVHDADGKPVPRPPTVASVPSNVAAYSLPHGSRLDWLVSHGGVSMVGDVQDSYALIVGGRGWLVPVQTAGTYRLHVRLRGFAGKRAATLPEARAAGLLLDLAPARLEVAP